MLRLSAFRYAWNGVMYFITKERHAPIHLFSCITVIIMAMLFKLEIWEWVALLVSMAMVLSFEILNSSLERLTDMVSPEITEGARVVKDLGAAAVLVSSGIAALIGLLIFVPKFLHFFNF